MLAAGVGDPIHRGPPHETRVTAQSIQPEPGAGQEGRSARHPIDTGLLELPVRRHHRARHGAVEQRIPGMGTGKHLRPAHALQQLQQRLRHRLAAAELGTVRLSSPAKAGDPGIAGIPESHGCPGVLDAPLSRGMTSRSRPGTRASFLQIIERHAPEPQRQVCLEMQGRDHFAHRQPPHRRARAGTGRGLQVRSRPPSA